MKLFWFVYYLFNIPRTKSEETKKYCRLSGVMFGDFPTRQESISRWR